MKRAHKLSLAATVLGLLCSMASAQEPAATDLGSIKAGNWNSAAANSQSYWRAKAQCWADLSKSEASQGDTRDTASIAAGNAKRIQAALQTNGEPATDAERSIYKRKYLPSGDSRHGRPAWRADIETIDATLNRYAERRCKTAKLGCLEVAQQSVYENMEETRGARWNHGRPEIDKALAFANEAAAEFEAICGLPQETLASVDNTPKVEPLDVVELPADMLFRFDRGDEKGMLPGGRASIGKAALKIHGYGERAGSLQIVGYTDRLGAPARNRVLSKQRASTVAELLQAVGVTLPIQPSGAGSAQPVTGDECRNVQPHAALVQCLQPDRRVLVKIMPSRATP